jgi:hypothetical protein
MRGLLSMREASEDLAGPWVCLALVSASAPTPGVEDLVA